MLERALINVITSENARKKTVIVGHVTENGNREWHGEDASVIVKGTFRAMKQVFMRYRTVLGD